MKLDEEQPPEKLTDSDLIAHSAEKLVEENYRVRGWSYSRHDVH